MHEVGNPLAQPRQGADPGPAPDYGAETVPVKDRLILS